jgi:Histidine kinase-, DNA gyrase B-, and HSP90-like ATPase
LQLNLQATRTPVQEIEVKVENDHIERLTTAKPIVALSELIWNAYDADAALVRVEFEEGALTKLALIRVQDDGVGIPLEEVESFFKSLGGSWKKKGAKTNGGRFIHGEKGQGRFKAFALGETVTWISNANGQRFSIVGQKTNLKKFVVSDVFSTSSRGCTVEVSDLQKDFQIRGEQGFGDEIRDVFALQLYEDPNFEIVYDGPALDAREAIRDVTPTSPE